MKALQGILGIALLLGAMAASGLVFSQSIRRADTWTAWVQTSVVEARSSLRWLSMAYLSGVGLFLFLGWKSRRRSADYLAYDNEGGTVTISLQALQDFLEHLKSGYPSIESLKPRVDMYRGDLDVELDVRVKAGTQIPELCRQLQDQAKREIRDRIGIQEIHDIRVRVEEIKLPSPKAKKQENVEIKAEKSPEATP
ncbi:MAG TPA: alkaline shock response membrane anchor protein AmaP [Kiritimatiellia bacterium]|nr:alkaline shock response membrane anchor protein AmaP [Kiritimatiellia bacterium]